MDDKETHGHNQNVLAHVLLYLEVGLFFRENAAFQIFKILQRAYH